MTSNQIRQQFFDFFKSKMHTIVASAPIVVKNDPTLMFTNAGMNQFKELFLGEKSASDKRIADTQKCLRVSGKHNDLEEVGHDTYHHTMFEMLGNWSFGDYFKKEAIDWAWELLMDVYKLPRDRIYATIFEGSKEDKTPKDEDAKSFWQNHLPDERILLGDKNDNFWEMGETGPCGPCSELHIDLRSDAERKKIDGATLVNMDHPQVIEIWNLVFMEFNRLSDGSLKPLTEQHVDTGMGFERLCMAIQGKTSNYDTDVFTPLLSKLEELSGKTYGKNEAVDIAMRVMADHVRAVSFTIADGQLPSNNKAGYVIRRILRRAVRYGYSYLGFNKPALFELVTILSDQMGPVFPELKEQKDFISKVVFEEEQSFLRTLSTGIDRFNAHLSKNKPKELKGDFAFELYDTYGFPIDLTEVLARENNLGVDMKGFEAELEKQKNRSRQASEVKRGDWVQVNPDVETEFVGYDSLESEATVIKYRKVETKENTLFELVLNRTPFYAEGGGQVGDKGALVSPDHKIGISDTKKENNLILHYCKELPKNFSNTYKALVSVDNRRKTESNHSVTHLLHSALKQVLGDHVNQKGSLVEPKHLRFDFSHFQKVEDAELVEIEKIVNAKIRENIQLDEKRDVPFTDAVEKLGATALFGEKYSDNVRVITFDKNYSVELCGGCHVKSTSQIGLFKITSESSVAAGVRRIEAVTGEKAFDYLNKGLAVASELSAMLNTKPEMVVGQVQNLIQSSKDLKKQLDKLSAQGDSSEKDNLKDQIKEENGLKVLVAKTSMNQADAVKDFAFELREKYQDMFMCLGYESEGKAMLAVMISDDLVKSKNLQAGQIIREIAKEIQGGGGGQPFFATAGGKNPQGIEKALEKAKTFIN